jgi:hypothetical protein
MIKISKVNGKDASALNITISSAQFDCLHLWDLANLKVAGYAGDYTELNRTYKCLNCSLELEVA